MKRITCTKFDIYVCITITGSTSLIGGLLIPKGILRITITGSTSLIGGLLVPKGIDISHWWTVSPQGYPPLSRHCFGLLDILVIKTIQLIILAIIFKIKVLPIRQR
jgi:hypothetical protein